MLRTLVCLTLVLVPIRYFRSEPLAANQQSGTSDQGEYAPKPVARSECGYCEDTDSGRDCHSEDMLHAPS